VLVPALSKQQGDAPDVLFGDQDERGGLTVDIADVWAVGARSDAAVYDEMTARVATLPRTPARTALEEVEDEDGVEFGEELTLYGDRPVVHREAVPVERVRLAVDDVPGEQTVTAARRRELVEVTDETQPDAVSRRPRR